MRHKHLMGINCSRVLRVRSKRHSLTYNTRSETVRRLYFAEVVEKVGYTHFWGDTHVLGKYALFCFIC